MKAIITVTGKDSMGIIAKVSHECAETNVNIIDISQSVLKEYFAMIMLVDIDKITISFSDFVDRMTELGKNNGLDIHTMHEDIFNSMHRI
jgi:ACT domain-containing protein